MSTITTTETRIEFTSQEQARTWFKHKYNSEQLMFFGNRVLNCIDFKHPGPQKLISDAFNTDITEDYID
jgi:cytochrome b involved in lipid metabolism